MDRTILRGWRTDRLRGATVCGAGALALVIGIAAGGRWLALVPLGGAGLWVGLRGVRIAVFRDAGHLVVRNQWRTHRIAWDQISAITVVPSALDRVMLHSSGSVRLKTGGDIRLEGTIVRDSPAAEVQGKDSGAERVKLVQRWWQEGIGDIGKG